MLIRICNSDHKRYLVAVKSVDEFQNKGMTYCTCLACLSFYVTNFAGNEAYDECR